MIHSKLAMTRARIFSIIVLISILNLKTLIVQAQDEVQPKVEISQPLPGEAVQGLVQVSGTIEVEDLVSYSLEFAYHDGDGQSWFGISRGDSPITEGMIGEWDTSSIPDNDYDVRLTVRRENNEPIVLIFEGIRVRNYSAIETNTPEPTNFLPTQTPTLVEAATITPTVEIRPSPTPLPPNPAAISREDIESNLIKGAVGGIAIFIIFLMYRGTRARK